MQNHGIPTRLLDWTSSFGVALFFAIKGAKKRAAVWILDAKKLNSEAFDQPGGLTVDDFNDTYLEYFIKESKRFEAEIVCLGPTRKIQRMYQQHTYFTFHRDLKYPLNDLFPEAVFKIEIEKEAFQAAKDFLRMSGINEFSLFPDLDGLARQIISEYFVMRKE